MPADVGSVRALSSTVGFVAYDTLTAKFDRAGRIVVAMRTRDNVGNPDAGMLVARLTADGMADSSFGNGGFFYDTASALARTSVASTDFTFDSADRILVAGYCNASFLVERIRGDTGSLDTSFGINGLSHGSFNDTSTGDAAFAIALDAGGRPIVGGDSFVSGEQYSALGRLTYDLIFTNAFERTPRGCLPPQLQQLKERIIFSLAWRKMDLTGLFFC